MDVIIVKSTVAFAPVYVAVTSVAIVLLSPITFTNKHSENEHELLGMLKNYVICTEDCVSEFEVPAY